MVMDDAGKAELAQMLTSLGHHLGTFLAVLHGYQMIQRTDVCKLCAELLGKLTVIVIPQAVERNDLNTQIVNKFVEIGLAQLAGVGAHRLNPVKTNFCQALDRI